jgi:tetratricopeptide (TPR) repeat protein
LIGVLSDQKRFDDIDRLVTNLRDRGIAAEDLAIATAFNAIRKKDYERGLALARQVIPANSTRYSDHLALGRVLFSSGKLEEAGKEFRQAVDLAPSVPETWQSWVEYLARTNQTKAARQAAAAAEQALPPRISALTLARCYWAAGEVNKAEALFLAVIKSRPHDAGTLRLAANFYLDQNRLDKVGPLLAELLKPETAASRADVAWAKRAEGMLGLASGVTPELIEQTLMLVEQDLKSDPNDIDAQRMRAVLLSMRYSRRKESIQALESMDRTYSLAPRERFLLATLYSAERDWPKCRAEMRKVLEEGSRQPRHLVFYVNLMIRLGELDEAECWLRTLKPLVPADQTGFAVELEARLLMARKQNPEVATLIRNYVERYPDQVGVAAFLLDRLGLQKEAEQACRASVARNPDEPGRTLALIEYLARQDRPQEALDLCEKAMSKWSPEPMTLASLAIYKARSATEPQRRKVENWVREAVHQNPDDVVVNTKLAILRTLQGNYTEAEAIYRWLLEANRDNVEVLNNLAWQLALRNKNSEEALKLVDRAIDIAGPNPTLLDTRAVVLMQLSQGDKAGEVLREAVSSDPDKPIYYFHLARALQMTNSPSEARKALEQSKVLGLMEESVDYLEREAYHKLCLQIALR